MTNKEALEASIAHHELNAKATMPDDVKLGIANCALCQQRKHGGKVNCEGCPVALITGMRECAGSPYDDVAEALTAWSECMRDPSAPGAEIECAKQEFRRAERREIAFLCRVLRETPEDILRITP